MKWRRTALFAILAIVTLATIAFKLRSGISAQELALASPFGRQCQPAEPIHSPISGYEFIINGDYYTPPAFQCHCIHGSPGELHPGDVVDLLFPITVGEPGLYQFRTEPPLRDQLILETDDGQTQIVGVRSSYQIDDADEVIPENPLEGMTPEQINGLWGLSLETWTPDTLKTLEAANFDRLCLQVRVPEGWCMPTLPSQLKYLELHANTAIRGLNPLVDLPNLIFLNVFRFRRFDLAWTQTCPSLEYLNLQFVFPWNWAAIAPMPQLRSLVLSSHDTELSFLNQMPNLRSLAMQYAKVTDLEPLGQLRELSWIDASGTQTSRLPSIPMPNLRWLNALSTNITDQDAAAFSALNPNCKLLRHWDEAFRAKVAGATRLRVTSPCADAQGKQTLLVEVDSQSQIQTMLANIAINESASDKIHQCAGHVFLEFYQEDELLAELSVGHGKYLRWTDGPWPADALLTQASSTYFSSWFKSHNITENEDH